MTELRDLNNHPIKEGVYFYPAGKCAPWLGECKRFYQVFQAGSGFQYRAFLADRPSDLRTYELLPTIAKRCRPALGSEIATEIQRIQRAGFNDPEVRLHLRNLASL